MASFLPGYTVVRPENNHDEATLWQAYVGIQSLFLHESAKLR
jgi:hypothetical protein